MRQAQGVQGIQDDRQQGRDREVPIPASAARIGPGWAHFTAWGGYPWVVLAASLLVQTSASFGTQSISPLAPALVADFDLSRSQVGLIVTAAYAGACLTLVVAGALSDRFGVRTILLLGLLVSGAPLVLASWAPDLLVLIAAMAVYGLGNGFSLPPTTRAIVEWFPGRHRGLAMGIKQTGVALAGVIMGLAVPVLAGSFGWRAALAVLGLATAGFGVIAWLSYRDRPHEHASVSGPSRAHVREVAMNRDLLLLCGVTFLNAGVQLSIVGFLVLFLRERLSMSFVEAGALLALAQTGGVVGRIGWGVVSDVLLGGRRKPAMALIGAMAASTSLALAAVRPDTPTLVVSSILFLAGISAIGWNGVSMTYVAELAGRRASATAAGLNLTSSYLGIMLFPPLFGLVVDWSGSYTTAFQAGAGVSALGLVLLSRIRSNGT